LTAIVLITKKDGRFIITRWCVEYKHLLQLIEC